MPNYTVEVFVHESDDDRVYKIVWVASYKDAASAIETAGRRAIGIANYMRMAGADIRNVGGEQYQKTGMHESKEVVDTSGKLKKLTEFQ